MSESHKIRIKIGQAEFEAEGPEDLVKEQFAAFMRAIATQPQVTQNAEEKPPLPQQDSPQPPGGDIDTLLPRVFKDDGVLSLLGLPKTDHAAADALLVLLYGYNALRNESALTGVTLMKSAKVSGVNIPRVDKVIRVKDEFIMSAGAKRGKRYSLNNRGKTEAEKIIREMLQ